MIGIKKQVPCVQSNRSVFVISVRVNMERRGLLSIRNSTEMSYFIEIEILSFALIPNGFESLIQLMSGKCYLNLTHK